MCETRGTQVRIWRRIRTTRLVLLHYHDDQSRSVDHQERESGTPLCGLEVRAEVQDQVGLDREW